MIRARFKITKKGSTDWVGMILGGSAIDCVARNGLGFVPSANSHWMEGLGIAMERLDQNPGNGRKDGIYALQVVRGSCDSDSDGDESGAIFSEMEFSPNDTCSDVEDLGIESPNPFLPNPFIASSRGVLRHARGRLQAVQRFLPSAAAAD